MHSPYMGWIVPYEWQETDTELDEYPPDCDSEGYLIEQN